MRSEDRTHHVIRGANIRHPIPTGFVKSVLQRVASGRYRDDAGAEQLHAEDIEFLSANVFLAHVNIAFETQERAYGRRSDSVLSGAGFRDDAFLAHAPREQALTETVVDLVRAGVIQVFTLKINLRAAPSLCQTFGRIQRSWPSRIIVKEIVELRLKTGVALRL